VILGKTGAEFIEREEIRARFRKLPDADLIREGKAAL